MVAHEHEEFGDLQERINELEAQDYKDEHAITQSISEKKILELTTFNLKTVQKFCDFSYLDPNLLYYVCADKYCPIHLPRNRRVTTYICKLCHKKRQALNDATSEYAIYQKAVVLAGGHRNIGLVTGLSKQIHMVEAERDKALTNARDWKIHYNSTVEKLKASHGSIVEELEKSHKKDMDDLETSYKKKINVHASHEDRLRLTIKTLTNQIANINDFEHKKATFVQIRNKLVQAKYELEHIQSQEDQAKTRLLKIKDTERIIQLVTLNPDWVERFQLIEDTRKEREELKLTKDDMKILCLRRRCVATLRFCLRVCEKYPECSHHADYMNIAKELQLTPWEMSQNR